MPESQSSDEDTEISQQMNLMHVTRDLYFTNSNKNEPEILLNSACPINQAFTSHTKAFISINGNTERESNINLQLMKHSTGGFVSLFERNELQESTKYEGNNISFDHEKSDLDTELPRSDVQNLDLKSVKSGIVDDSFLAPLNKGKDKIAKMILNFKLENYSSFSWKC